MSENTSLEIRDIEKRELNHIVASYEENRNELLERVPELIDWDMFTRKISPEMVDVLRMQHKRLKNREMTIKTQEKGLTKGFESGKVYYLQKKNRYQDGPYTISVLQKKTKRIRKYYGGKEILAKAKDKGWVTYFVRQEPEETVKLSSEDRVSGLRRFFSRGGEYKLVQKKRLSFCSLLPILIPAWFGIAVVTNILYLVTGILLLNHFYDTDPGLMLAISLLGAAALNFSARGTLIYMVICHLKRAKSYKVLQSIREQWPDFCMEKFISMASNRLKCIFYADSMADIGDFVSCDLTNTLVDYANVIDCETMDFRFEKMSQDEDYYYIDVRQKVLLTGDLKTKIKRKKLTVKLRFMRPKESIMSMDFYRDWYIGEIKIIK